MDFGSCGFVYPSFICANRRHGGPAGSKLRRCGYETTSASKVGILIFVPKTG
jgi:hypothetical protein